MVSKCCWGSTFLISFSVIAIFAKCVLEITFSAVASSSNSSSSRNIWVSGLSSNTKAADLKNLFGKYGKVRFLYFRFLYLAVAYLNVSTNATVILHSVLAEKCWNAICCPQVLSAKVVTNARSPGSKCYGLVTLSSSTEVTRCISHLDCTELHGQKIYVERVSWELVTCFTIIFTFYPAVSLYISVLLFFRPKMIHSKKSHQRKKQRTKQVPANQVISAVPLE